MSVAMYLGSVPMKNMLIWACVAGAFSFLATASLVIRLSAIQVFAQETFILVSLHEVGWTCK
jgi:hypothetical protein